MRKILLVLFIAVVLIFSGCNTDVSLEQKDKSHKSCKIEILSGQENTLLATVHEQKIVDKFIQTDKWQAIDELPKDLIPKYKLIVYQEKTLLYGQDPDEKREYEIIESITTYQDTSYAEVSISPDVIKNMKVPDEFLTVYYIVPDETMNDLQQLL